MILITTIEHGVATAARDILIGARAAAKVVDAVQKEAPGIEAITALVDPRAAAIERIGVALIGQAQPQIDKLVGAGTTLAADAQQPSIVLSAELTQELVALFASMKTEIGGVKATVTAAKAS